MSATSGDFRRKRRRESGREPEVINLSDDDDSVIDLTNEQNSQHSNQTRRSQPPPRVRFGGDEPTGIIQSPARSPSGQGHVHPERRVRFREDENDSDDEIEIISINTTPNSRHDHFDTNRPYNDTARRANRASSSNALPDNYFDLSLPGEPDSLLSTDHLPTTHIDTPSGYIEYQPDPNLTQSQHSLQRSQEDQSLPPRNVRRRVGRVPVARSSRGSRLPPPHRQTLTRRIQIPPGGSHSMHFHVLENDGVRPGTGVGRQNRGRGRGAHNQRQPPRPTRRSSLYAHGAIPDFVRINFNLSDLIPDVFFHNMPGRDMLSEAFENNIMQRIEEDNNRTANAIMERGSNYNRKSMAEKQKLAEAENAKGTHTNKISADDNLVCELCSVCLGEGAPEEFKGDPKYDLNFAKYAEEYQTQAPWFCVNPFTDADHDLSKRVFASKCGHTFCGRCVKNIAGRPSRKPKDAPSGFTIKNPSIFAPTKCPAKDCGKKFVSKAFTEVFF